MMMCESHLIVKMRSKNGANGHLPFTNVIMVVKILKRGANSALFSVLNLEKAVRKNGQEMPIMRLR